MTTLRKLTLIAAVSSLAIALLGAMPTAEAGKRILQRTKSNIQVGKVVRGKANSTRRVRTRSGKTLRRAVKAPRNSFKKVRSLPRGAASVNKYKTRPSSPPPPSGPKLTSKPGGGVVADLYCGGKHHVPCDSVFTDYCALIGGTMSKSGTTCYHETEW